MADFDLDAIATRDDFVGTLRSYVHEPVVVLTAAERDALVAEVDRLRAENAALAGALVDIADGECARFDDLRCHQADAYDPHYWCPVCVAEVAWCAWRMGALA